MGREKVGVILGENFPIAYVAWGRDADGIKPTSTTFVLPPTCGCQPRFLCRARGEAWCFGPSPTVIFISFGEEQSRETSRLISS